MNLLDAVSYERLVSLIHRVPMKVKLASLKMIDIMNAIGRDKKHVAKKLRFVLPVRIGEVKVVDNVEQNLIRSAVKQLLKAK
jgi:3-dehydroquinate synthase